MTPAKTLLGLPKDLYTQLLQHLLKQPFENEEAAFVFVRPEEDPSDNRFTFVDWFAVPPEGFEVQLPYHFELTDLTRASMIKRAHDLGASVVEFHSHKGRSAPAFSPSDWAGFEELVPHMWWRLKGRPYMAVVVSSGGFDGFAWLSDPGKPVRLDGIVTDGQLIVPSRLSPVEKDGYERTF